MRIIIATHNQNKVSEFRELLNSDSFEVLSLKDLNENGEIIEDGKSYIENAIKKVQTIGQLYPDDMIIGDDSGFSVKALNHEPGIYSSRYLSDTASQKEKNDHILRVMEKVVDRKAMFYCAMALSKGDYLYVTQAVVYGTVSKEPRGNEGFGYDPIFIPQGESETYAQNHQIKKHSSHRAKALREILNHVRYLQD